MTNVGAFDAFMVVMATFGIALVFIATAPIWLNDTSIIIIGGLLTIGGCIIARCWFVGIPRTMSGVFP